MPCSRRSRVAATLPLAAAALVALPSTAAADTLSVCASGCDHPTIGAAVTAATPGDTVSIGAGSFAGNVTVDKPLTIVGAGRDATTITGSGFRLGESADGTTISDLAVVGPGSSGNGVWLATAGSTVEDITLTGLRLTGLSMGISTKLPTAAIRGWTLEDVDASGNGSGAYLQAATTDFHVADSRFDSNNFGLYVSYGAAKGIPGVFDDVTVTDSTFNDNDSKGLYLEAVSNAVFQRIVVDGTGGTPDANPDPDVIPVAGVDVNVKYTAFENVRFEDSSVTNTHGTGMTLKGRNDGSSYGPVPGSLEGLVLTGMTVTGSVASTHNEARGHGIAVGYGTIAPRIVSSRIAGNEAGGLYAYVDPTTSIDARDNWWGCNGDPSAAACNGVIVEPGKGPVQSDPWVVLGVDLPASAVAPASVPVTASIARNSAGGAVAGLPEQQIALSATGGTLSSAGGLSSGGAVAATLSSDAVGTGTVTASLDGVLASGSVRFVEPDADGDGILDAADCAPLNGSAPSKIGTDANCDGIADETQQPEQQAPSSDQPGSQPQQQPGPVFQEPSANPPVAEQASETLRDRPVSREEDLEVGTLQVYVPADQQAGRRVPVVADDTVTIDRRAARRGTTQTLMALSSPEADAQATVTQTVRIGRRTIELPVQELVIPAGASQPVQLPLTRAMRRALRRGQDVELTLTITVIDDAGNRTSQTKTFTVEAEPKPKKKKGKRGNR